MNKLRCLSWLLGVFIVTAAPTAAHANAFTIASDGAWVQKTQGSGPDTIKYVVVIDELPAGASSWKASTVTYDMGTYNDHGGASEQEVRKVNLARLVLNHPGDRAEVTVCVFGHSDGSLLTRLVKGGLTTLRDKLAAAAASAEDPLAKALAAGGAIAAHAVSSEMARQADDEFVGSLSASVVCEPDGTITWSYKPIDFATDKGRNPEGSYRVDLHHKTGEYWFKILGTSK